MDKIWLFFEHVSRAKLKLHVSVKLPISVQYIDMVDLLSMCSDPSTKCDNFKGVSIQYNWLKIMKRPNSESYTAVKNGRHVSILHNRIWIRWKQLMFMIITRYCDRSAVCNLLSRQSPTDTSDSCIDQLPVHCMLRRDKTMVQGRV